VGSSMVLHVILGRDDAITNSYPFLCSIRLLANAAHLL
jgi:hypothetical protein